MGKPGAQLGTHTGSGFPCTEASQSPLIGSKQPSTQEGRLEGIRGRTLHNGVGEGKGGLGTLGLDATERHHQPEWQAEVTEAP